MCFCQEGPEDPQWAADQTSITSTKVRRKAGDVGDPEALPSSLGHPMWEMPRQPHLWASYISVIWRTSGGAFQACEFLLTMSVRQFGGPTFPKDVPRARKEYPPVKTTDSESQ